MKGVAEGPATLFTPAPEALATAKLFMHGGSQAVRLPKAFRFEGSEVVIRKEGDQVILEPKRSGLPRTSAEVAALRAEIVTLMAGRKLSYPTRDRKERADDPE